MQVLVEEMTQEIYKFISKLGFIEVREKDGVYKIYAANTYGDLLWTGDASEQDIKDKFGEQLGALILTRVEDAQSGRIYQREIEPIVDKYKEQFSSFSKDKASELYKLAKKHFGTTTDMRLGLYLNVDGSMLKADGHYRARTSDHREIQEIMTEYDGSYLQKYGHTYSTNNNTTSEAITRSPADKMMLYSEFLKNRQNIYTMIFKDLDPLFYQII